MVSGSGSLKEESPRQEPLKEVPRPIDPNAAPQEPDFTPLPLDFVPEDPDASPVPADSPDQLDGSKAADDIAPPVAPPGPQVEDPCGQVPGEYSDRVFFGELAASLVNDDGEFLSKEEQKQLETIFFGACSEDMTECKFDERFYRQTFIIHEAVVERLISEGRL